MKRGLFLWIELVVILFSLSSLAQDNKETRNKYPQFNFVFYFSSHAGHQFDKAPLSIRAVPVHPDDGYLSGCEYATSPLPDRRQYLRQNSQGGQLTLQFNQYFSLGISSAATGEEIKRYRQNQYGTPERGYGTSLRWYQYELDPSQVMAMAYVSTPRFFIFPYVVNRFTFGGMYSFIPGKLSIRSGYDRFNHDEDWRFMKLADFYEHRLFIGYEVGCIGLTKKDDLISFYLQVMYLRSFPSFSLEDGVKDLTFKSNFYDNIAIGLGFMQSF